MLTKNLDSFFGQVRKKVKRLEATVSAQKIVIETQNAQIDSLSRMVEQQSYKLYGVAIYNFGGGAERYSHHLQLDVGDLLEIESECRHWYSGRKVRQQGQRGIFPKTYVELRSCTVERSGGCVSVSVAQSPIVREITQTLREWAQLWRQLYLNPQQAEKFKFIEVSMRALLEMRREILSGTLPQDKLRKVEKTCVYSMDRGNRELGMDLTIRNASGSLVDPFEVSTCTLNALHDETNEQITRNIDPVQTVPRVTSNPTCYSFFVSVRNFVCKMSEDSELLMSLYDATQHRQFTESYVVPWSKAGLMRDIEHMHNLKVVFTDLGLSDTKRERVFLVCFVVRRGGLETQNTDHRYSRSSVSASVTAAGRMLSMVGDGRERHMRRPFGVAATEVTRMLSGQQPTMDDQQFCVPFFACERENLDSLLKKIICNKDAKPDTKTTQGLWISIKLLKGDMKQIREDSPHLVVGNVTVARKMGFPEVILPGDARNDLYMTLVGGSFTKGGGKSTDRNIEVTVRVADKYGRTIPSVISLGGGTNCQNEYNSVVYYHEDKPRWQEVFKICIPIDEFKQAHVVFLFRHRSSNEAKDKAEKHFALSYTPLMQSNGTTLNDTTHHLCVYKVDSKKWPNNEMEAAAVYMSLPSVRAELPAGDREAKLQRSFLTLVHKDVFSIETNVCSTKLTQNVELLGVLNWTERVRDGTLRKSLRSLQSVPGEEVVKFLQDILDALFNILTQVEDESGIETQDSQESSYDVLVFECLLYVIALVSDLKYHHFQPVLDVYIQENFCDTLAYVKLLRLMSEHIRSAESGEAAMKSLLRSMKCLEYLVRFVVRSRELHAKHTPNDGDDEFRHQFRELLESMVWMMQRSSDAALTSQGTCIKYLPCTVRHIIRVYPDTELSVMIGTILDVLPLTRLTKQRLMTVLDLVQGPLFLQSRCRRLLVPHITPTLRTIILNHDEYAEALSRPPMHRRRETNRYGVEMRTKNRSVDKVARVLGASRRKLEEHRGYGELLELCVKTLSELLTLLHRKDVGPTVHEYRTVAADLLRTIINTTMQMQTDSRKRQEEERDDPMLRQIVSVLLDMLRQMTKEQYETYIEQLGGRLETLGFVTETQNVLQELVQHSVYRAHSADMINMQNFIILNTLRLFSTTLVDVFYEPFERQVWLNWFHLTIDFITQPALQLETMRPNQVQRLVSKYNDMRREAAFLIKSMWYNLREHKRSFIPCLVGPFLEMSLTPEVEVRKATIPLFFDMMQCEYHHNSRLLGERESGLFKEFENEMIDKLDTLVESGKGDTEWRSLFVSLVGARCLEHDSLRDAGSCFVAIIGRLVDTLLLYRDSQYRSTGHHMQVTTHILEFNSEIERRHMYIRYVNKLCSLHGACGHWAEAGLALRSHATPLAWSDAPLAARLRHLPDTTLPLQEFYSEIERPHMYIRYVNKLCSLHGACGHWAEAGLALRLHATLLAWSDAPLAARLRHPTAHARATTHRQLKEALYLDIIEYLHKGKMWELAVEVCKELVTQYEDEVFDYHHLSGLYYEMSKLYKSIMMEIRPQPEYFRVVYYGLGFPEFLRIQKGFVHRGEEYERLQDFTSRLLNNWPDAEVLTRLEAPGEEIVNSPNQYVQINAVTPIMCDRKKRLSGKPVSDQILNYYKYNNVNKFIYSRPLYRQEETDSTEEESSNQNEFASLWLERTELEISDTLPGILRWFPVVRSRTFEMSPLEVAVEKMQETNKVLKSLVLEHKANDNIPLDPLTRKLNGMVDAAVMGGIVNYERAFFRPHYLSRHPDHADKVEQLKELIADQIPLLEFGVEVHRLRAPQSLAPLHKRIAECFEKMRAHVHEHYGQKICDLSAELPPVTLRRHVLLGEEAPSGDSRLSELSTHTIHSTDSPASSNRNTATALKHAFNFSNAPFNKGFNPRNSLDNDRTSAVLGPISGFLTQSTPRKREKRRPRKSELGGMIPSGGGSMWYTSPQPAPAPLQPTLAGLASPTSTPASPLLELRQPLTPSRPLRSEVERERRLSQRPISIQSGIESNRNSIGTTDSNQEEDEPPPLPQKASKTEHKMDANDNPEIVHASNNNSHGPIARASSLSNTLHDNGAPVLTRQDYDIVIPPRGSFLYSSLVSTKKAPTPPPKKKNRILS